MARVPRSRANDPDSTSYRFGASDCATCASAIRARKVARTASLTCAHRADTAARFGGAVPSACASRSTSAINARSGSATPLHPLGSSILAMAPSCPIPGQAAKNQFRRTETGYSPCSPIATSLRRHSIGSTPLAGSVVREAQCLRHHGGRPLRSIAGLSARLRGRRLQRRRGPRARAAKARPR
jgi:hypothetical protein